VKLRQTRRQNTARDRENQACKTYAHSGLIVVFYNPGRNIDYYLYI